MFLLPFIMEHSSMEMQDNEENTKKKNFYDYIYLISGNELLKFEIELDHMDVVNVLEKYIDSQKTFDKVIMSEKELKGTKIPLKFLYPLGYYRLENNLFKTNNYLVPKQTPFLDLITKKYWNGIVDTTYLDNINYIKTDAVCDEDDIIPKLVDLLFENANIELVERFEINKDELIRTISNIKNLFKNNKEALIVLSRLKWIIEKSKSNIEYITKLCLKDKFNSSIMQERERQKVK